MVYIDAGLIVFRSDQPLDIGDCDAQELGGSFPKIGILAENGRSGPVAIARACFKNTSEA